MVDFNITKRMAIPLLTVDFRRLDLLKILEVSAAAISLQRRGRTPCSISVIANAVSVKQTRVGTGFPLRYTYTCRYYMKTGAFHKMSETRALEPS